MNSAFRIQPNAISSDRPSRQRIWRSTTKGRGHQTDESTKGQESSAEFPGNGQLFEALLSQVDETIQTTQTAASGRNGMDLGLFLSRCLRCHQRRALQDPSTHVLWLERRTRYSDWRFHVRIRCRIAARRKTSDLRIQISHSRWGTLFQHRERIARSGVRHGEASQLSVWWTNQSSNRSQTSRNDLEEEYCHCQPETSTTPSEACKIRNSSRVHLWEGQLNCRRPESSRLSQSKAYGLKADNRLDRTRIATTADPALNQLRHYIFHGWPLQRQQLPERLQHYWNYREELAVEDGLIFKAHRLVIPTSLWAEYLTDRYDRYDLYDPHSVFVLSCGQLRRRENSVESTRDSRLARNLGWCEKCS